MDNNEVRVSNVEMIQFIRSKGKRVPMIDADGKIVRDERGKMRMIREKGNPNGVLIAALVNGKIRVGWSCVNKKQGDSFNKERALEIAKGRLVSPSNIEKIPYRVFKTIDMGFADRCEKYFGMSIDA